VIPCSAPTKSVPLSKSCIERDAQSVRDGDHLRDATLTTDAWKIVDGDALELEVCFIVNPAGRENSIVRVSEGRKCSEVDLDGQRGKYENDAEPLAEPLD
jgi:hypothetical protein